MKRLGTRTLGIAASIALASSAAAQTNARPVNGRQSHYEIGVIERVLENAVEHGAAQFRDRLSAVAPDASTQMLILDNPRVRGFRLEKYGVFFDVEVPSLNGTLTWSLRTLDQNDLGLQSALNVLKTRLDPSDVDLQQALKRVELQFGALSPVPTVQVPAAARVPLLPNPRRATGSAASTGDQAASSGVSSGDHQVGATALAQPASPASQPDDKLLENPNEAYRQEVVQALADAMLDHSSALGIGDDEWLTIAARGIQDQPRLGPPDNDGQTVMIRLRGADLSAFRANQITRDEVIKRMDRQVF
jgi:hypothetical protein